MIPAIEAMKICMIMSFPLNLEMHFSSNVCEFVLLVSLVQANAINFTLSNI
jgi:hypothetical protein